MTEAYASNYWISPTALYITLNALGMPNYIQANTAGGSVIMCHVPEIIGYDDGHNYRRWQLIASPTLFNTNTEKYVYVQIPRDMSKTTAMVVFPSEHIDIYGKNEAEEQIGSADYYYIWLQAKITATDGTSQRKWDGNVNHGTLSTDEAYATQQGEWFKWDAVTQMVTFVKTVFSATINYLTIGKELIFGEGDDQKKVTQIADGTDPTDVSPEHIATPAFVTAFGNGHFLRKDQDDETEFKLTMKEAEVKETLTTNNAVVKDTIASDNFVTGAPLTGSGWAINRDGDMEAESLRLRGFMEVPEIRFNRASIIVGTNIQSECGGIIETVTPLTATTGICTLHLDDDDIAGSVTEGDLCWGYWHDVETKSNNAAEDSDDHQGEINYKGFCTIYFQVAEVLDKRSTRFRYELRPDTKSDGSLKYPQHPYAGMHFGGRGNSALKEDGTPKNPSRQGFTISTPRYTAIYQMVGSWDWSDMAKYIVSVQGYLDGFEVVANETPGTWHNNYGTIAGNIYYKGKMIEVESAARNMYITQSGNGVLQADEEPERVSIVIRDALFVDKTADFTIYVNGQKVFPFRGATQCVLEYAYEDLQGGVNRFSVVAKGTRQIRRYDEEQGGYVYETEAYQIDGSFVIRKEAESELTMQIICSDTLISENENKLFQFRLISNTGYDRTAEAHTWKIERETSDAASDMVWNGGMKAQAFAQQHYINIAQIYIKWSSGTDNDLDPSPDVNTTTFTVTAKIGEEEVIGVIEY